MKFNEAEIQAIHDQFVEAFPAHKFTIKGVTPGISEWSTESGVGVEVIRIADDSSWRCFVIRKTDVPILIERGKVKLDVTITIN